MLSLDLAGAIRAAAPAAELEVSTEDGSWRGGVMASSPDDTQRMAWEGLAHSRLRSSVTYLGDLGDRMEAGHRGSSAGGAHGELFGFGDRFL